VWSHHEVGAGHGVYYTYSVTTGVGTQEAVDPYARTTGVNGNRGMVIDLDSTNPVGFDLDTYVNTIDSYTDAIIWEVHVRDFSNKIESSSYKGKYLAFTETGLTNSSGIAVGVDYVVDLGVTHVHLLPVYDYQTVDETNPDGQFNWGYDPKNYNVPEGSYSTDPYHGEVRVNEFKQMVMALHKQNLGVVMDVVYNHTYDGNSSLNKIVPYYYYRYTSSGENSNGSGCGNETASNRYMFSKFMVDSVTYWAREYHVDGFRFDLMALHDVATMQKIEQALHAINPNAIIYGEGWTGGTSALSANKQASQANIKNITVSEGAAGGIAVFNDVIRDGLKGSVFEKTGKGYINGAATSINLAKVKFGIRGSTAPAVSGWTVNNSAVINYVSAHDNHTLWDKLEISCPNDTVEKRLSMNRLAVAVVMLSQGTPFMQAGEEMLRTKGGDENSYKSPDSVNNINWESLTPDSNEYAMHLYYKGLIALRKSSDILTANGNVEITFVDLPGFALLVKYVAENGDEMIAVINPTSNKVQYGLDGEYVIYAQGDQAGTTSLGTIAESITVAPMSVTIIAKNAN
jgi:pullulanase